MAYFVTGATGFIGRYLVTELVENREGTIYALCREGSRARLQALVDQWGEDRVVPVVGDLSEPDLGVDPQWIAEHRGDVDHVFHLAAIYDMTASDELNEQLNVGGTRNAVALAEHLGAGCFHQVSSVAASGDFVGVFDETMFDEGQRLPSPYHRTKFESERIVREECEVPWRVYRPAVVVGDSETGAMDKVDGPYYFFPLLKRMRDALPGWVPLVGVDLGDTNVVPVDYVAKAMDHLAHVPGHDGEAFHLVNPEPMNTVGLVNTFAAAANAPRFAVPVDRTVTGLLPTQLLPRALRPAALLGRALHLPPVQLALAQTIGRLGIPPEVLGHVSFSSVYASRRTERALAGSGISVPDLDSYAPALWSWWEEKLDDSIKDDGAAVRALANKTVVITGASSGIGLVTAVQVARAGGVPVLVARGREKLDDTVRLIQAQGGTAHAYPCDLSDLDAIDALTKQLREDFDHVDFVVNNAGRSIRRSLKLSEDRFHDFERTMQLNYYGAIRLVMGLLPAMREQQSGHIVNVSSIGVLTSPPRFSAYVASKAALDAWSNVVSSELVGDGISFTTIHMPLVRTPMIAPTKLYDRFPTISPGQAARKVITALVDRPHEINTKTGNLGALAHTLAPKTAFRILHLAYQVFPDSTAAKAGTTPAGKSESEQLLLARLLQGVHW
ncbi:Thioester reductase domain-containing protein [Nocardioides scoriae]|uniref:Thioester reductase domain-containing protein n=1 Tax=Nocardioides scoriae TaxID=642780 RepID=A0A1H1Q6I5_9ACTN|nr:SDR family oxidoreductase [Nocardioides scoriae]SDS19112.1 Thioester reductase domain-containing protein [Nocardioides scoriae]